MIRFRGVVQEITEKSNMKYLRYGLHCALGLLILAFLFTRIPFKDIASTIEGAKVHLLLLSFLVGVISIFMNAWRWKILLNCLGYKYGSKVILKITFIGVFFNIYLPGGVIGDVTRVAILPEPFNYREDGRKNYLTKVAASVVADRFVGLVGLMLIAVTSLGFVYKSLLKTQVLLVFGVVVFIISIVFFTLFSRRTQRFVRKVFAVPLKLLSPIKAILKELSEALFVFRDDYLVFSKTITLSILGHICVVVYFFLLARAIDVDISFIGLLAFVPIIEFVSALPISVGGVGVREITTILLFSSVGVAAVAAMSISLLSFVIILLLGAIGGIFFIANKLSKKASSANNFSNSQ